MSDIFTVKCATCGENDVNYMGTTCKACRDNFWTKVQNTQALIDENTVLRTEVEELRKDRERLEFIFKAPRVEVYGTPDGYRLALSQWLYTDGGYVELGHWVAKTPREAIDAAIEAANGGEEDKSDDHRPADS